MPDEALHPLEFLLRQCAGAAPDPWYPTAYAQATGTPREKLDPFLDQLRMGGLIQLTEWVPNLGQGYALTPEGARVVQSSRLLSKVSAGVVPTRGGGQRPPVQPGEIPVTTWSRGEAVRMAFMGSQPSVVTYTLILINILFFLAGLAVALREGVPPGLYLSAGPPEVLHQIGQARGEDIYLKHEWWRLITTCFVHVGFFHLLVNMYSLFAVGPLLERLWGRWCFLALYLIAGLGGACGGLLPKIGNPVPGAAGASGALWGILASMAIWLYFNRTTLPRGQVAAWRQQLITVFILNLLITLFIPQISKGGHFGGGLAGMVAAVPMDSFRFGKGGRRWLALAWLIVVPLICLGILWRSFAVSGADIRRAAGQQAGGGDFYDFETRLFPKMRILEDPNHVWPKMSALLKQQPVSRDDPKVTKALADIEEETRTGRELADLLSKTGPYQSPGVEQCRQLSMELVREWLQFMELARAALDKGEDRTKEDERAVRSQYERMMEVENQWVKFYFELGKEGMP